MTFLPIVSAELIKVFDSLLCKYISFQRNREAGSTPRSYFHFFFFENTGVEVESDRLIFIISTQISLFETDSDASMSSISIIQQVMSQTCKLRKKKNLSLNRYQLLLGLPRILKS